MKRLHTADELRLSFPDDLEPRKAPLPVAASLSRRRTTGGAVALGVLLVCCSSNQSSDDDEASSGGSAGAQHAPGGSGGSAGSAAGLGGSDSSDCTLSNTAPDATCQHNCDANSDTEAACLAGCPYVTTMKPGLVCSGVCVDVSNDKKNCGACGHVCSVGSGCANSSASGFCLDGVCDCDLPEAAGAGGSSGSGSGSGGSSSSGSGSGGSHASGS